MSEKTTGATRRPLPKVCAARRRISLSADDRRLPLCGA